METKLANRTDASASSRLLRAPTLEQRQARVIALKPRADRPMRMVEHSLTAYAAGAQTLVFEPPDEETREHVLLASACLFALVLLFGLAACAVCALVAVQLLTG